MAKRKGTGSTAPPGRPQNPSKKTKTAVNNNNLPSASARKPDSIDSDDGGEGNSTVQYVQRKSRRKTVVGINTMKAQSPTKPLRHLTPDEREEFLHKIGAPREVQVTRANSGRPHPSRGGSRGYSDDTKIIMMDNYILGLPVPKSMERTIRRWLKNWGVRKKRTGNNPNAGITGEHIFLIALFKVIWPTATRKEVAAFVALYSGDGRVLTDTEVTDGYKRLNLTRKKGSTTAYQAFTPKNSYLHFCFWNYNFPGGVRDVPIVRLMDGDEMAFHLGDASQGYGHAVKGLRVRKAGNYSRSKQKVVVIMFIEPGDPSLPAHVEGSKERPRIWYRVSTDSGTTIEGYRSFLENDVFPYFRDDEPQRTLMHDNLSSHKAPEIYDTIYDAGHRVICRPPYRPYEAPIEWVFNQLACAVRLKWKKIKNEEDLVDTIISIIENRDGLGGFYELFQLCGYKARERDANNTDEVEAEAHYITEQDTDEYDTDDEEGAGNANAARRYDAIRLADKFRVRMRSWESLGFQCGACYSSLPLDCAFNSAFSNGINFLRMVESNE